MTWRTLWQNLAVIGIVLLIVATIGLLVAGAVLDLATAP